MCFAFLATAAAAILFSIFFFSHSFVGIGCGVRAFRFHLFHILGFSDIICIAPCKVLFLFFFSYYLFFPSSSSPSPLFVVAVQSFRVAVCVDVYVLECVLHIWNFFDRIFFFHVDSTLFFSLLSILVACVLWIESFSQRQKCIIFFSSFSLHFISFCRYSVVLNCLRSFLHLVFRPSFLFLLFLSSWLFSSNRQFVLVGSSRHFKI